MARYSTIRIGNQWLTDDGTSTGSPCRSQVTGLGGLSLNYTGSQVLALDGTPYVQLTANAARGKQLTISLEQVPQSYLQGIAATINSALASSAAVAVDIRGDAGDFSLQCLPQFPDPLELSGEFVEGRVRGVTVNLTVQSRSRTLAASAASFSLTGSAAATSEA